MKHIKDWADKAAAKLLGTHVSKLELTEQADAMRKLELSKGKLVVRAELTNVAWR